MKSVIKSLALIMTIAGVGILTSCKEELAQVPANWPNSDAGSNSWGIGTGTWEDPMQTWQAHLGTMPNGRESNWVTGYLVGCINSDIANSMNAAELGDGEKVASQKSNVLLAQIPYDKEVWEKMNYSLDDCVPVQLPYGATRNAVNLQAHPENFNKQVSLRGTTGSKYMGVYGLRSTYEYNWGPKGKYEESEKKITDQYFCDFSTSHDISYYKEWGWSIYAERGWLAAFVVDEYDGVSYATTSAYNGNATGGPYIDWLISPELNLDNVEQKTVSFRTQVRYGNATTNFKAYILTDKNPTKCEPIELSCPISTADNNWVSSGIIDLSQYSGKIYIGFRYYSEKGGENNSGTYNMTDFNFGGANPEDWIITPPAAPTIIGKYRLADSIETGKKYAMVFENKYVTLPASTSVSYGRLNVADLAFSNEEKTEFEINADYAFTFKFVEDNYWTIQDYLDRYIYMDDDSSHNTFQIGSKAGLSNLECSWEIEKKNDYFVMVSYFRGFHLEYNSNFANVAPNSGNYVKNNCAKLYEMYDSYEEE